MQTIAENRPPKVINVGIFREGISEDCGLRVGGLWITGLLSPPPAALYRDLSSPLLDSALNLFLWQVLLLKTPSLCKRSINPVLVDGVCFQEAKAEAGEQFHGSSAS